MAVAFHYRSEHSWFALALFGACALAPATAGAQAFTPLVWEDGSGGPWSGKSFVPNASSAPSVTTHSQNRDPPRRRPLSNCYWAALALRCRRPSPSCTP